MEVRPGNGQARDDVIPADWTPVRLGGIGRWFSGGTPSMSNSAYWGGKIPWVSPKDMKESRLRGAIDHVSDEAIGHGTRLIPAGALLVVVRGMILAHSFPVARAECPLAFNQDLKAVVTRDDIDSNFLLHWLQSKAQQLRHLATESTHGTKRIPTEGLFSTECICPPLPEQRAIAGVLGDVDALLGALTQLIAKKRDLKQAAMQRLLTAQTRLPGFRGKWEITSFGNVLSKIDAKVHQIQTSGYQVTGRFPVVDQSKKLVVGFSDRDDKLFRCPDGGVIVFGDHTCVVKFVDFDFVVGADGTQILATKVGHCARFHALHLQHRGISTTGYNRHFKFLKERPFVAPPLTEQTAIAFVLSDMEAEIVRLEQQLAKIRSLKQGMMQELLTGRTRLV